MYPGIVLRAFGQYICFCFWAVDDTKSNKQKILSKDKKFVD